MYHIDPEYLNKILINSTNKLLSGLPDHIRDSIRPNKPGYNFRKFTFRGMDSLISFEIQVNVTSLTHKEFYNLPTEDYLVVISFYDESSMQNIWLRELTKDLKNINSQFLYDVKAGIWNTHPNGKPKWTALGFAIRQSLFGDNTDKYGNLMRDFLTVSYAAVLRAYHVSRS